MQHIQGTKWNLIGTFFTFDRYPQQTGQQSVVHYSSMNGGPQVAQASSMYHPLSALMNAMSAASSPNPVQAPVRQHVVEVPVPVYVPMGLHGLRNMAVAASARPMMKPVASRMMPPKRMEAPVAPTASPSGHVAIVYYHNAETETPGSSQAQENTYQSSVPVESAPPTPDTESNIVRILLRPKGISVPEPSPFTRFSYHRRIDEPEDDQMVSPSITSTFHDGRMRQWRDYTQSVQTAPAPMAHVFIAAHAARDDQDSSPSEEHYQQYQEHEPAPIYYSSADSDQSPIQSHIVLPHTQQLGGRGGHGATFLVLADPNGVHHGPEMSNGDA